MGELKLRLSDANLSPFNLPKAEMKNKVIDLSFEDFKN
jgi:hypothetical protein